MSEPKSIILKIGGSVFTDKSKESAEQDTSQMVAEINRLVDEIKRANIHNLITVHGGGSIAHSVAKKYVLKEGFKEESQKIGFAETHNVMTVLNGLFMEALILQNIPAVSVTSSSFILTKNERIHVFEETIIKKLLKMGLMPVLYGDVVLDTERGFTILSGDQLVVYMAMRLNAERIIMGVDVDGLYNADPKSEGNAKMFTRLTLKELKELQNKLGKSTACDVTGGMLGKIRELIPAIEHGIPVSIVNATKKDYLYKVLEGEKVEGTLIEKE